MISNKFVYRIFALIFVLSIGTGFKKNEQKSIPIIFRELDVEIINIPKLGDTLLYKLSSKETFKFVLFDTKGRSYCERYVNNKLFQKGNFENSIDTLKRYVSGRGLNGKSSAIRVQKYFEPLKNGEWITYNKGKKIIETYLLGIRQKSSN